MLQEEIRKYLDRSYVYRNYLLRFQSDFEEYKKTDNYKLYDFLCEKEANLIESLAKDVCGKNKPIDAVYMVIFIYLYRNGYLSVNNFFEYAEDDELYYNMGLSITSGKGICRHIATHFSDILRKIHKDDKKHHTLIAGTNVSLNNKSHISNSELPSSFKMHIASNDTIDNMDVSNYDSFLPNHMETLVIETLGKNAKIILYDPTNIRVTKYDMDSDIIKRNPLDIRVNIWSVYSPYSDVINGNNLIDFFDNFSSVLEFKKKIELSKKELKKIIDKVEYICNIPSYKVLLNTYFESYKEQYQLLTQEKNVLQLTRKLNC